MKASHLITNRRCRFYFLSNIIIRSFVFVFFALFHLSKNLNVASSSLLNNHGKKAEVANEKTCSITDREGTGACGEADHCDINSVCSDSSSSSLGDDDCDYDGRGVARIKLSKSSCNNSFETMSSSSLSDCHYCDTDEIESFVTRNEPFVCRGCIHKHDRALAWWSDDNNLKHLAGDAIIRVRAAPRTYRGNQSFSKESSLSSLQESDDDCDENGGKDQSVTATPFRRYGSNNDDYANVEMTVAEFLNVYRTSNTNTDNNDDKLHNDKKSTSKSEKSTSKSSPNSNSDSKEQSLHYYAAQLDINSVSTQIVHHYLPILPDGILETIAAGSNRSSVNSQTTRTKERKIANSPNTNGIFSNVTMYLGQGGTLTPLHYDSYENFVCIVSGGYKIFELYDPITSAALLYMDQKRYGNTSPVQQNQSKKFPLFQYALPSKITLRVGDCMFVPIYWFHSVQSSTERTCSINYWLPPNKRKKDIMGKLLCGHQHREASAEC